MYIESAFSAGLAIDHAEPNNIPPYAPPLKNLRCSYIDNFIWFVQVQYCEERINRNTVDQIKSLPSPPAVVCTVMQVMLTLLSQHRGRGGGGGGGGGGKGEASEAPEEDSLRSSASSSASDSRTFYFSLCQDPLV